MALTPPAKVYTRARMEGGKWERTGLRGSYPCSIAVAPDKPSLIYVSTIGDSRVGFTTELLRSFDGCARWTHITKGLPHIFAIQ
jgi:hypothetical protein